MTEEKGGEKMKIEARFFGKEKRFCIYDSSGNCLCWFDCLSDAALVRRYLDGERLTDSEMLEAVQLLKGFEGSCDN